jgi:diguanylate cyclase (GGDEF)-like protein/PAS domain S-box-containing protein
MNGIFDPSSYHFTWYAAPVLIVGLMTLALGIATLVRERGSTLGLTFMSLTGAIGVLYTSNGMAYAASDPGVAEAWIRLSVVGTIALPVTILTHIAGGSGQLHRLRLPIVCEWALTIGLAVISLSTDWFIRDFKPYFWGYYPIFGVGGLALAALNMVSFGIGGRLFRTSMQATQSPKHKKRMRIRMLALAVAIPASVDYLPAFHIGVYPFGWIFIAGFVCASTYTIWKYRMVDITPALAARQIIGAMAEGLLVVDRDGIIRLANRAAESFFGEGRSLIGVSCAHLDARHGERPLTRLLDPDQENHLEVTYGAREGSQHTLVASTSKLEDHLGEWVGTVYILHDITERFRAEAALRQSEERFRSLVQNASDLITVIDADTTVRYQSPSVFQVLGYDPREIVGTRLSGLIHADDISRIVALLSDRAASTDRRTAAEMRVRHRDGTWRDVEFIATDQRQNPAIRGFVLNIRDVSERRALERQLRHQALHDPLTRLANRTRLSDRLEHALIRTARSGKHVGVIFIDLDNFKGVNDSLGHSAGDRLLAGVAERLQACVRPVDTVARLGGDEFAILLEDVGTIDDATAVAQRIFSALETSFDAGAKDIVARASMGIAISGVNGAGSDVESLLRDADVAMYAAKAHGRNRYEVFEDTMQSTMMERLELLADLQAAPERGELVLHYQPMILLTTGGLFGMEALARWQHPKRGLLQPAQFIALAEESGAIIELGRWVLEQACKQARAWQNAFPDAGAWTMSINVSVKQLQHPAFVDEVAITLAETGMPAHRLILEITETMMMMDLPLMMTRLRELKDLGVQLAIDDFGTGYSSLSYLQDSPFDLLKIDKSFIDNVADTERQKEVTRAIIELGKTLDLGLVAEGIERTEQLSHLRTLDCDLGQGFLFSQPLESAQIEELLGKLSSSPAREAA